MKEWTSTDTWFFVFWFGCSFIYLLIGYVSIRGKNKDLNVATIAMGFLMGPITLIVLFIGWMVKTNIRLK